MELTKSFPPADDLYAYLQQVDYKKLYDEFLTVTATVLAVIVGVALFVKNAAVVWYNNGGKEQLVSIANRVGLFDKLSRMLIVINNRVEKIYFTVADLTDA